MEMDTEYIQQEINYLEGECIPGIQKITSDIETYADAAAQCMDSQNGQEAARQLIELMEYIRSTLPSTEESLQKLVKVRTQLGDLTLRR